MNTSLQAHIIREFGVKPEIDPWEEIEKRVMFLVDYLEKTNSHGFVLGISGGVDSTLAGRLAQIAAEYLRSYFVSATFVGVRLPYGTQLDEADAQDAMKFVNAHREVTINIAPMVDSFRNEYNTQVPTRLNPNTISDFNLGNVKARARMVAQYAIAGDNNYLVIGCDHAAEAVTGFYTKHGDGGADVLPLAGLNKRQIRQMLQALEAPEHLWAKVPTADLLDNAPLRTDETELGVSYDEIDDYLEGKKVSDESAAIIERKFLKTRHKRTMPVTMQDEWWKQDTPIKEEVVEEVVTEPTPVCLNHQMTVHRDGKVAWCNQCGLDENMNKPVRGVAKNVHSYPPTTIASDGHEHSPRQKRDGKPAWCNECGLTADMKQPRSPLTLNDVLSEENLKKHL